MTIKELETKYNELDEKLNGAYALIREQRELIKMQEAAIRDLEEHQTDIKTLKTQVHAGLCPHGDMQNRIVNLETQIQGSYLSNRDMMERIKGLERKLTWHKLTLNLLYGVHAPIEWNEKPAECGCTSEENDVKEALDTLCKFCNTRVCSRCPFCGDKPIASRCKLVKNVPCTYNRLELTEETK